MESVIWSKWSLNLHMKCYQNRNYLEKRIMHLALACQYIDNQCLLRVSGLRLAKNVLKNVISVASLST